MDLSICSNLTISFFNNPLLLHLTTPSGLSELSFSFLGIVGVDSGLDNLDNISWLLIVQLQLLNEFEGAHALDHSSEDHVLVVQESQWGAKSHIELALVGVLQTIALAHTQQSNICVLHLE